MFNELFKVAVGVVSLPASVIADVVTLGGALTDEDKPYTVDNLSDIMDNLVEARKNER